VAQLIEGSIATMNLTRTTAAAALLLTVGSITSGIALRAMGARPASAEPGAAATNPAQAPPAQKAQAELQARARSSNNLKAIAIAMHNYASFTEEPRFPGADIRGKDGKPLLSWRVAILPYLEHKALYDRFHLDEDWNGSHNKTLLSQIPDVYAPVIRTDEPRGYTYYQVLTGRGALFEDERGPRLLDIKDGTSNTISLVEAGNPVPWTKPEDVVFDTDKPLPKLGRLFDDGFHAAFADGSVLFLSKAIKPDVIRWLITSHGGEDVRPDMFRPKPESPKE
jgi:hypothetical protein